MSGVREILVGSHQFKKVQGVWCLVTATGPRPVTSVLYWCLGMLDTPYSTVRSLFEHEPTFPLPDVVEAGLQSGSPVWEDRALEYIAAGFPLPTGSRGLALQVAERASEPLRSAVRSVLSE